MSQKSRQTKDLRSRIGSAAPWVVIVVGLFLLVRPIALQWIEAWQASKGIDSIVATYDEMGDPERQALREEARRYNADLFAGADLSERLPYVQQLVYRGSEMIAYISIPKCSVRLPIYHGTEDKVLMAGVGHLIGSSLPAGGESSHSVLTAHSGMQGRRMFDDIHLLEPGDHFVIWVLGEPLAYEVSGSEVVLPDKTDSLAIEPGRDLVTLVTCTPYGINSHRLLVHGERCPYEEGEEEMADLAVYVNNRTLPFLIALLFVLLLLVGIVWRRLKKWHEGKERRRGDGHVRSNEGGGACCEGIARRRRGQESDMSEKACAHGRDGLEGAAGAALAGCLEDRLFPEGHTPLIAAIVEVLVYVLHGIHVVLMRHFDGLGRHMGAHRMKDVFCRCVPKWAVAAGLVLACTPGVALADETTKIDVPVIVAFEVKENSTDLWQGISDYPQGVNVPYSLVGTLPSDLPRRTSLSYWLVVNFADGLDVYPETARVFVWHEDDERIDITDELKITFDEGKKQLRAGSDDIIASWPGLAASDRVLLTCETRLNDRAGKGFDGANVSWAHLEYEGVTYSATRGPLSSALPNMARRMASVMVAGAFSDGFEDLKRSVEIPAKVYTYDLKVHKLSQDTGRPLQGAGFILHDENGLWYVRGKDWSSDRDDATVVVTDEDGVAVFPYIDSEYYEVIEVEAPRGYLLREDSVDVDIDTDVPVGQSATYLDAVSNRSLWVTADSASGLIELAIDDEPELGYFHFPLTGPTFTTITTTPGPSEADGSPDGGATTTPSSQNPSGSSNPYGPSVPTNSFNFSSEGGSTTPTNVIRYQQALSKTGDDLPLVWPMLILSLLFLGVALILSARRKGWINKLVVWKKESPNTNERKHHGNEQV